MAIRNKTPHVINVVDSRGNLVSIPPELPAPRIQTKEAIVDTINGINVYDTIFENDVENDFTEECETSPDDTFVTSMVLKNFMLERNPALKGRILSPGKGNFVDGKQVSCNGLSR